MACLSPRSCVEPRCALHQSSTLPRYRVDNETERERCSQGAYLLFGTALSCCLSLVYVPPLRARMCDSETEKRCHLDIAHATAPNDSSPRAQPATTSLGQW